ncbi:MAG TPA: iron-containing alcohol dehydrogenase [Synergistales bacterium]|nr:iron-containing alcohol dehydrogenase [Synergistales bacterium]
MFMAGRIQFGPGVSSKAGDLVRGTGAKSALIVTDETMERLGVAERITEAVRKGGVEVSVFSKVEPEPSVETTDEAAKIARGMNAGAVIGLGGGSSMDVAKAVAVLVNNEGSAANYQGLGLVKKPGVPKIMIPTTSGTGSEVTFTAVLIRKSDGVKGGINSDFLYPEMSLLDPELAVTMPPRVTASTGMDALAHALEAYTSLKASPFSDIFAEEALVRIGEWLRVATFNGNNIEARGEMMLAALFGGVALANAGVTACHALAYPLGGMFGVPHGIANALLIPHVARWNAMASPSRFTAAAELLGYPREEGEPEHVSAMLCSEALGELADDLGLPETLEDLDVGITEDHFEEMAIKAMGVARPMENNPRVMTKDDCVKIYMEAM